MADRFADMFDERYLEFYEGLLDLSLAEDDVSFVDRALALVAGASVLDLGCGFGRHALGLARRGYRVTCTPRSASSPTPRIASCSSRCAVVCGPVAVSCWMCLVLWRPMASRRSTAFSI
jgi:predicted RNA methylase